MHTPLWVMWVMALLALLNATGQFFNKLASKELGFSVKGIIKNKYLYAAIGIFMLGTVFYLFLLPYGEISVLYSLSALSYFWSMILAKIFLKENINIYKWVGVLLIIMGVAAIGLMG